MEYTLAPSEDGAYLEVTVIGEVTRAGATAVTEAHFEIGERLGIRCFLIDVTKARNVQSVVEDVHFTLEDIPELEPRNVLSCVALLVDATDHTHDFHTALARSHGVDISIFWDRDEAIAHLREAAPQLNVAGPSGPVEKG